MLYFLKMHWQGLTLHKTWPNEAIGQQCLVNFPLNDIIVGKSE